MNKKWKRHHASKTDKFADKRIADAMQQKVCEHCKFDRIDIKRIWEKQIYGVGFEQRLESSR